MENPTPDPPGRRSVLASTPQYREAVTTTARQTPSNQSSIQPQIPQPRTAPIAARFGLGIVALLAIAIAGYSIWLYATASLETLSADDQGLASTYVDTPSIVQIGLYIHIATASLALVIGPLQFVAAIRRRAPRIHRVVGRVYLGAVAIAALASLAILPFNSAAFVGLFGFGALAVLWLFTLVKAYTSIRRREVAAHRAWMMRNYALTFAAPTLRLWLGVLIMVQVLAATWAGSAVDIDVIFPTAYAAVPFLCWIPNLIVAEWLIRRRGLPSYRLVGPNVVAHPS